MQLSRRSDVLAILKEIADQEASEKYWESFTHNLKRAGLRIRCNIPGDGNCLFNAVCDQLRLLKIQRMRHLDLRHRAVNYLRENPYIVRFRVYIIQLHCNRTFTTTVAKHGIVLYTTFLRVRINRYI